MPAIPTFVRDRMIDHIRGDTTDLADAELQVPVAHFVSSDRARKELAIQRRSKLIAAHASELPEAGSFITCEILGVALLITRGEGGAIAAFLNMCRHRGGRVEQQAAGLKTMFTCAYHGWSYTAEGKLRGVPFERSYGSVDKSCRSLIPVGCEERHGFIWIDLSNSSASVADYLEAADEPMASFGFDKAVVFLERTFEAPANWKLVMDGAVDLIHPQFLHPGTVGSSYKSNIGVWLDHGRHGQTFSPRTRLVRHIREGGQGEVADWRYFGGSLVLYPNAMAVAMPEHVEFWTVWPSLESPSHCTVKVRSIVDPLILTPEMEERLTRSMEILEQAALNEDFPMEATIQRNSISHPGGSYLYGRSEVSCQHLHLQLERDIAELEQSGAAA